MSATGIGYLLEMRCSEKKFPEIHIFQRIRAAWITIVGSKPSRLHPFAGVDAEQLKALRDHAGGQVAQQ